MRLSVILAHPRANSFNHALAAATAHAARAGGHEVCFHDLQAEAFDAVLLTGEETADAAVPTLIAVHRRETCAALVFNPSNTFPGREARAFGDPTLRASGEPGCKRRGKRWPS